MPSDFSIRATHGGMAAGRDQHIQISIQLIEAIPHPSEKQNAQQREGIKELLEQLGTSSGILHQVATRLIEHCKRGTIASDQVPRLLIELVQEWQTLAAQEQALLIGPDNAYATLQENLAAALKAGEPAKAQALYELKRDRKLAAMQKRLDITALHNELVKRDCLEAAECDARLGRLAMGCLEFRRAAEHFAAAAIRVATFDSEIRLDYLSKQVSALHMQGRQFADWSALAEAIDIARLVLKDRNRECAPLQWANTQKQLGDVIGAFGERNGEMYRIEEAITAYKAALEEITRERAPQERIVILINLGCELMILGERECGIGRLEEAVDTLRAALQEMKRECQPLDWVAAQHNLGNALKVLSKWDGGATRLEEAITAYKAALEECTRVRQPFEWAVIHGHLGGAIATLGNYERSAAKLDDAVAVFRLAFQEMKRERWPFEWALMQSDFGLVLHDLGKLEEGTARLDDSIAAFRAALQEMKRERLPLEWATIQNNLGQVLCTLGQRERGTEMFEQAVEAYEAALKECTRGRAPSQWASCKNNLGDTLWFFGERTQCKEYLEAAFEAISSAADVVLNEAKQEQYTEYFQQRLSMLAGRIAHM